MRGTDDDFNIWSAGFNYFAVSGRAIDAAALGYHARTNKFIRDLPTLLAELKSAGVDAAQLKDRWGRDYGFTFDVSGRNYLIRVFSRGPDGVLASNPYQDDFEVWKNYTDYFSDTEREINRILSNEVNFRKRPFPRDESKFLEVLRGGGLDLSTVNDGYGRPVYIVSSPETRFTDKIKIENGKTTVVPITEEMLFYKIRSRGADPVNNADDSDLATFSGAITAARGDRLCESRGAHRAIRWGERSSKRHHRGRCRSGHSQC